MMRGTHADWSAAQMSGSWHVPQLPPMPSGPQTLPAQKTLRNPQVPLGWQTSGSWQVPHEPPLPSGPHSLPAQMSGGSTTGHSPLVSPWPRCFFSFRLATWIVCPLWQTVTFFLPFFLPRFLASASSVPSKLRLAIEPRPRAASVPLKRRRVDVPPMARVMLSNRLRSIVVVPPLILTCVVTCCLDRYP